MKRRGRLGSGRRSLAARIVGQNTMLLAAMAALLLVAAGDWRWPQAWVFLAENAVGAFAMSAWLARHDPALLAQRMSSPIRGDQRAVDRLLIALIAVGSVGWMVLMALDARRFAWSTTPLWAQALGGGGVALCFIVVWRTFRCNSFAVPQIRVQTERAQTVVSDGPYRVVRHPMYTGAVLLFCGTPLLLGSLWGLVGSMLLTACIALRAVREERLLRQGLQGYDAYADHVRFRLVPGLW